MKKTNWTILHNKLPPTQLRELDLLGRDRFVGHKPPLQEAGSPSSHSSFCEEVFSVCSGSLIPVAASPNRTNGSDRGYSRMRWTGQIFWLLAYVPTPVEITFFPPSPPKVFGDWPNWEVVSSYSSATAPDSHGISCAESTFSSSQRTGLRTSGLRSALQELFNQPSNNRFLCHQLPLALTSLSPAAPVSSARISHWLCRTDSRTRVLR